MLSSHLAIADYWQSSRTQSYEDPINPGSAATMVQEVEVSSGEHKLEERGSCKGSSGMNAPLRQSKGFEVSHLSYSGLASLIEEPTKQCRETLCAGRMNHREFLQCGNRKKSAKREKI